MRLTAHEVDAVKFSVTIRGYAEDEVDAFLDLVAATLGEYESNEAGTSDEVDRLQSALEECRAARMRDSRPGGAPGAGLAEAEARTKAMVEEAARASERMVEEALEAGEHILDQIRRELTTAARPAADAEEPDAPAGEEVVGG